MTIPVLFISPDNDPALWQSELSRQMPGLQLIDMAAAHDKATIEIALVWKPPHGVLAEYPSLKLIQCLGMGVDALFADPDLPRHVPIARLVDLELVAQMSEYVCWAVLHHHRCMDRYADFQRHSQWQPLPPPETAACRIGILGLGIIGMDVAGKLKALGFNVHGWTRAEKSSVDMPCFFGQQGLDDFLPQTDILICLLPLTKQTQGIMDRTLFDRLPRRACVINVARGGHLVSADLLTALDSGQISAAFLDVVHEEPLPAEHPFWTHPRIHLTPHIAGLTTPRSATPQIVTNIRSTLAGKPVLNRVDADQQY